MADVFISYARTERERAEQIKSAVEGLGLTIFFDVESLEGGDVFPDVLDREVKSAGCVLGIWSPHALSRPWIKTECLIGKDRCVLIPVLVEPVNPLDMPAVFYSVQTIDLTDFAGDLTHPGWIKLVKALARTLRRPELIAASKPKPVQGGELASPVERYDSSRMPSKHPKTEIASWIAAIVSVPLAAIAAYFTIWPPQSAVGPQTETVSPGPTIPTNPAVTEKSLPAEPSSASVAPATTPDGSNPVQVSTPAADTQEPPKWDAASSGRDAASEPAIPSPSSGVSPSVAELNRTPLDGVKGKWRGASDPNCQYAIQIEVRDNLLLWTNPRDEDPLTYRVTKADMSEISAQSPDGTIATFNVHTQSFRYKTENWERPQEYARCL
jgi:hypothetical protein